MNTKVNTDASPEMTAWEMACSCLVGLSKSLVKARNEYDETIAAAANNPRGQGVMQAARQINVIGAATRGLEDDMRQFARSSGLAVPDLETYQN
jgi:hypothetical protein